MSEDRAMPPVATVENATASGPVLIICEHASCHIPAAYGDLGLTEDQRRAHIAWDPGALDLARALARRLDAPLVHAGVSRLVYDLNRPPHAPGAMPTRSEVHDIPGNQGLTVAQREQRTHDIYLPFHEVVRREVATRLAKGQLHALVTVHSFTPVYFGQPRAVELGIIHDSDPRMAQALVRAAERATPLVTRLNEPYSAADGVTHTLALHATPMGLPHVMIELRNDLIASTEAQNRIADHLAPCIRTALSETQEGTCRAG